MRCGDEHAFGRTFAGQAACELLDRRATDPGIGPMALGLNADRIQPRRILVDDAIDPASLPFVLDQMAADDYRDFLALSDEV